RLSLSAAQVSVSATFTRSSGDGPLSRHRESRRWKKTSGGAATRGVALLGSVVGRKIRKTAQGASFLNTRNVLGQWVRLPDRRGRSLRRLTRSGWPRGAAPARRFAASPSPPPWRSKVWMQVPKGPGGRLLSARGGIGRGPADALLSES